ncbi:MAG: hypothetical protein JST22_06465 [Bacteroidetes bacterium]|nr:hypothetical protein [Bacteroidota bacterium]
MMRTLFLPMLALLLAAPTLSAQEATTRTLDSTLTQKYSSEFGYSFMLPARAKQNPIGSTINAAGRTQTANFLLSGGFGAIKIWNYAETQVVPAHYKTLDSIVYYETDSAGVNGTIHIRTYIMDSIVVRMEVLLTAKGATEFGGSVLKAMFDSFVPPPNARKQLAQWRYEFGKVHNGGSNFDWEKKKSKDH